MAEQSNIAKIVLFLGLLFTFLILIFPSATGWENFQSSLRNVPTFVNPFSENFNRHTAVPDSIVRNSTGSSPFVSFVGCENTTFERKNCINTDDDVASYVRFNFTTTPDSHSVLFNLTDRGLDDLDHTRIRRYTWTISCRTVDSEVAPRMDVNAFGVLTSTLFLTCQTGTGFSRTIYDKSLNGTSDLVDGTNDAILTFRNTDEIEFAAPGYTGTVDVSYIRLEIVIGDVASGGCQAPDGAWFPWVDEVACAIGQFGQIVWKGILFIVNGIIYIGQVLVYFAGIAFSFLALFSFIFAIPGAPLLVQGIITVFVITFLFLIILHLMTVLRGSGTTG